jgi:hypothetical protein
MRCSSDKWNYLVYLLTACGSVAGRGTMLQAGMSRVRIPMRSLDFSIDPGVDSASNRNEYQESLGSKGRPARKADNLTAICEPIV